MTTQAFKDFFDALPQESSPAAADYALIKRTGANDVAKALIPDLVKSVSPPMYALRSQSSVTGGHVYCGPFSLPGVAYSDCYYDTLVAPMASMNGTGYLLSMGYGGAHTMLLGFSAAAGYFSVTGNVWNNATSSLTSFATQQKFKCGQLYYIGVKVTCDDGSGTVGEIVVYVNGVAEGRVPFLATNRTTPANTDSGFWLFGSDHNMSDVDYLLWLRNFEKAFGQMPALPTNYAPFRVNLFPMTAINESGSTITKPTFLMDFTCPRRGVIPDLSDGLNGTRHNGILAKGARVGGILGSYPAVIQLATPANLPYFVGVPDAIMAGPSDPQTVTVPPTAKVYDSFSNRERSPFWSDVQNIGSTEGGTAGVQAWVVGSGDGVYGISAGKVFAYGTGTSSANYALADAGSQTQDIKVSEVEGTSILILGRYVDSNNFVYAQVFVGGGLLTWLVAKCVAGTFTTISGSNTAGTMPAVVEFSISGTAVILKTDGTTRVNTTASGMPTGTEAGFLMTSQDLAKIGLFEVY